MNPQNNEPTVLEFLGLDLEALKQILEDAPKLEDDEQFFAQLAAIAKAKAAVKDVLEEVERYEADAKGLINTKAKALYGPDWQAIAGEGFKITRSFTGSVYNVADPEAAEADFLKVEFKANARTIEEYRETHDNTLPAGIELNEKRGESLRVTVKG